MLACAGTSFGIEGGGAGARFAQRRSTSTESRPETGWSTLTSYMEVNVDGRSGSPKPVDVDRLANRDRSDH
jgi:hypothetical protein